MNQQYVSLLNVWYIFWNYGMFRQNQFYIHAFKRNNFLNSNSFSSQRLVSNGFIWCHNAVFWQEEYVLVRPTNNSIRRIELHSNESQVKISLTYLVWKFLIEIEIVKCKSGPKDPSLTCDSFHSHWGRIVAENEICLPQRTGRCNCAAILVIRNSRL